MIVHDLDPSPGPLSDSVPHRSWRHGRSLEGPRHATRPDGRIKRLKAEHAERFKNDETFYYWNLSIDERDPLALWIPTAIDAMLKADPRHPALLARMNLGATIISS